MGICWLDDAVISFFFSQQNSLIGGLEHEFYDFPYVGNVIIPNWRTPSFFRGVGWKHQPVKQCEGKSTWMEIPQEMARKNWGTSELRNIDGNGGVYQWKIQILKIVLKIMIQNFHFPFKYLDI